MVVSAIILGIVIFMFLVLIHEYGHFRAARNCGVKVEEFGIGIPPKAMNLGIDAGGTVYTANIIPLGGFVRLKGEDPNNEADFLASDSFITATLPAKLLILFGGIIMNLLFAWFAFSIAFWQGVKPFHILPDSATPTISRSYLMPSYQFLQEKGLIAIEQIEKPVLIRDIGENSRAAMAGLQSGDQLLSIAQQPVTTQTIGTLLTAQQGKTFSITYNRNGSIKESVITCESDECVLGVSIGETIQAPMIQFGRRGARQAGAHEVVAQTQMTRQSLKKLGKGLFSFNKEKVRNATKGLAGPVGIVKMIELVFTSGGRRQLLAFGGMISLALAIFNLLPIPALDGGRALSVLIQAIGRRKPTSYFVIEGYLNMICFILMMLLGIRIILKDLVVFWGVHLPFISG